VSLDAQQQRQTNSYIAYRPAVARVRWQAGGRVRARARKRESEREK